MKKIYAFLFPVAFFSFTFSFAQTSIVESFEPAPGGSPLFPTRGWVLAGPNVNYLFATTSGSQPSQSPNSGSYELEWNSYNAPAGDSGYAISPRFDLSQRGANNANLSFMFYRDITAYNTT